MGKRQARTFEFEVNRVSSAPPGTLFRLETDADAWSRWARPLVMHSRWEREGEGEQAGPGAIRRVGTWPVLLRERTMTLEPDRLHAYTFVTSRPLKDYQAEVRFSPNSDGGTDLCWRGSFRETLPGSGAAARMVMRAVIGFVSARLVRAAERSSTAT